MTSQTMQQETRTSDRSIRPSEVAGKASFVRAMRAEWLKLRTLRSMQWMLAISLVGGLGLVALIAWGFTTAGGIEPVDFALIPGMFAAMFGMIFFGVLGVLTISNEYSSGMILSSMVAQPKRGKLFAAKLATVALIVFVLAVILEVGALLIAGAFEPKVFDVLGETRVLTGALGIVIALTCIALMAFGLAAILRNAAGSIAIVLALVFVVPILLGLTPPTWEWTPHVQAFLPDSLLQSAGIGLTENTDMIAENTGNPESLNWWQSLLGLGGWALLTLIPAGILFKVRDAK